MTVPAPPVCLREPAWPSCPWPSAAQWREDTAGWPCGARALASQLLDAQWRLGTLPAEPDELRRLLDDVTVTEWARAWPYLDRYFPLAGSGRRNPGLEMQYARGEGARPRC